MDLPYISNANYISTYRDRLRVSLYKNLREGWRGLGASGARVKSKGRRRWKGVPRTLSLSVTVQSAANRLFLAPLFGHVRLPRSFPSTLRSSTYAAPPSLRNFPHRDIHSIGRSVSAFSLPFISYWNEIEIPIRFLSRVRGHRGWLSSPPLSSIPFDFSRRGIFCKTRTRRAAQSIEFESDPSFYIFFFFFFLLRKRIWIQLSREGYRVCARFMVCVLWSIDSECYFKFN